LEDSKPSTTINKFQKTIFERKGKTMSRKKRKIRPMYLTFVFVVFSLLVTTAPLQAETQEIIVTVENLAPSGGFYFTPVWVGLHNGSFDLFDPAGLASEGLERVAEDGDASALQADFEGAVGGAAGGINMLITAPEGFAGAPVFDPGEASMIQLTVDSQVNSYMSFLSMIIPSNDAFIGNHNPMGIELFDAAGKFKGKQIVTILGSMVWDAGTELNNEMDAAFINQTAPNTGVTTTSPVLPHPGFLNSYANPGSAPIILGGTGPADIMFDHVAADFTQSTIRLLSNGRGNGPVVFVRSQELYYDSIITADPLPRKGKFQRLFHPDFDDVDQLETEYGPGDPGHRGGRWWVDVNQNGEQDDGDHFFSCPLLGPGREDP
jgi:hypothetical protein